MLRPPARGRDALLLCGRFRGIAAPVEERNAGLLCLARCLSDARCFEADMIGLVIVHVLITSDLAASVASVASVASAVSGTSEALDRTGYWPTSIDTYVDR